MNLRPEDPKFVSKLKKRMEQIVFSLISSEVLDFVWRFWSRHRYDMVITTANEYKKPLALKSRLQEGTPQCEDTLTLR
jgi:hypothetical protein